MNTVLSYLPYAIAAWLFFIGLFGIVQSRHLLQTILCLTVVQSSTYLLLLSIGFRKNAGAPIFSPNTPPGTAAVDPIVQALTLTDIVVGATVAALLMALTIQIHRRKGTADPRKLREMRG